mmetsp:Transcript_868/g.2005  ORF Transcript_868/g.2005 Transcript_868/m.2005 type:complete len:136 (+) Transcript_868:849-1256(+)
MGKEAIALAKRQYRNLPPTRFVSWEIQYAVHATRDRFSGRLLIDSDVMHTKWLAVDGRPIRCCLCSTQIIGENLLAYCTSIICPTDCLVLKRQWKVQQVRKCCLGDTPVLCRIIVNRRSSRILPGTFENDNNMMM